MSTTIDTLTTVYMANKEFPLVQSARNEAFAAKMAGKAIIDNIKDLRSSEQRAKRAADPRRKGRLALAGVNGVHYATDEPLGAISLAPLTALFTNTRLPFTGQHLPEIVAAGGATLAETAALSIVAGGLGLVNLKFAKKDVAASQRQVSVEDRSQAVFSLGVPFATMFGYLKNKGEVVRQTVSTFAGSHLLVASGVVGGSFIGPEVTYGMVGGMVANLAVGTGYEMQMRRMGIEPLEEPETESKFAWARRRIGEWRSRANYAGAHEPQMAEVIVLRPELAANEGALTVASEGFEG